MILSTPRSGSMLLVSYLNSIKEVSCQEEILNPIALVGLPWRGIKRNNLLNHISYNLKALPHKICGAKCQSHQLNWHQLTMSDFKTLFPNMKFIVLHREDLLEQYLSMKEAEQSDEWLHSGVQKKHQPISLDLNLFSQYIQKTKAFYEEIVTQSQSFPTLFISYENLRKEPQTLFDHQICPFLNVPPQKVGSTMTKQNKKNIEDRIQQYSNIKEELERIDYRFALNVDPVE